MFYHALHIELLFTLVALPLSSLLMWLVAC